MLKPVALLEEKVVIPEYNFRLFVFLPKSRNIFQSQVFLCLLNYSLLGFLESFIDIGGGAVVLPKSVAYCETIFKKTR